MRSPHCPRCSLLPSAGEAQREGKTLRCPKAAGPDLGPVHLRLVAAVLRQRGDPTSSATLGFTGCLCFFYCNFLLINPNSHNGMESAFEKPMTFHLSPSGVHVTHTINVSVLFLSPNYTAII